MFVGLVFPSLAIMITIVEAILFPFVFPAISYARVLVNIYSTPFRTLLSLFSVFRHIGGVCEFFAVSGHLILLLFQGQILLSKTDLTAAEYGKPPEQDG